MGHFVGFAFYFLLLITTFSLSFKNNFDLKRNLGFLFIGLFASGFFIAFYFSFQKDIPFWDSVVYWKKFNEISSGLNTDLRGTLERVYKSMSMDDYTDLPALLLAPALPFLGKNYTSYIESVNLFFLLPAQFSLALLIRDILKLINKEIRWSTIAIFIIVLLSPYFYIAAIRGYLDAIGLLFVLFFLRYCLSFDHETINWKTILLVSLNIVLLGFTRRWYLFWLVSFWPVYMLITTYKYSQDPIFKNPTKLKNLYLNTLGSVIVCLAIYYLLFPNFIPRITSTDYSDIYSAFKTKSRLASLLEAIGFYGYFTLALSVIGFYSLLKRQNTKYWGLILITQLIFIFLLFSHVQDFGIHHYYLFTGTVSITAGLGVLELLSLAQAKKTIANYAITVSLIILYCLNFFAHFLPRIDNYANTFGGFLGKYRYSYPLIRNDYTTIYQIIGDLNDLTKEQNKNVYVLASSFNLNDDLLRNAYLPETGEAVNGLLDTKDIDKRDGLPHDLFLKADYILTASPVQLHLDASGQQVVDYFAHSLLDTNRMGKFYKEIKRYKIANDKSVDAILYEKKAPFSLEEIARISDHFKKLYPDYPQLQIQSQLNLLTSVKTGDGYSMVNFTGEKEMYIHPGATQSTVITINFDKKISHISFQVIHQDSSAVKSSGNVEQNGEIGFKLFLDNEKIFDDYITSNRPRNYSLDLKDKSIMRIEVSKGKFGDAYDGFFIKNINYE